MAKGSVFIRALNEIRITDIPLVGGKTASLGEMYNQLSPLGVQIPLAFAVTAEGYKLHLAKNNLMAPLRELLAEIDSDDDSDLRQKAYWARKLIMTSPLPAELEHSIIKAYEELSANYGDVFTDVAVRSSATAEDLPEASFAGQQESYLNIRGPDQLLHACKKCFASVFTERAIVYRVGLGFDHFNVFLSICIQKMVRSDLATAGVAFTVDPESGFKDLIVISAAYGLGESVVQGSVTPDEYLVFKQTLSNEFRPILKKTLGSKEHKVVYDEGGERMTKVQAVPHDLRMTFALTDDDIMEIAKWSKLVEEHYSAQRRAWTPMDIEWAKDGITGKLFLVQARPETVAAKKSRATFQDYHLLEKGKILCKGQPVGKKITRGKIRILTHSSERHLLEPGEILVTSKTDPDWEPALKKAAAIITELGSRTCHAAIIAREIGIPAIVGVDGATKTLKTGDEVTVYCGEQGIVFAGSLNYRIEETDLSTIKKSKTQMMLNIADPARALHLSFLPHAGIGLAREEFIVTNHVKVHPLAITNFEKIRNPLTRAAIENLAKGSPTKEAYYVNMLSEGIGLLAAAFYPYEVILRLSDFKTNEYRNLLGGDEFEPIEENPMLGFRGASRYYHPDFASAFALECRAVKKVREYFGLSNLKVMIPFCRTPLEATKVLQEMEKHGLKRGELGLEVYVMCEIPSNVILAEKFAKFFDGFSIGSNDLTQLVLGVDRESSLVANLFDEKNEAVMTFISEVIHKAKKAGRKIGICGQAPSDYPEFAAFLVREGIDSISLNPDSFLSTLKVVLKEEENGRNLKHGDDLTSSQM